LNFFNIPSEESAQGRSQKRPRANSLVLSPFDADFVEKSTNSPRKRTRKTTQLSQFSMHQDKTPISDTDKYSGQDEPTPIEIGPKLGKICPNISVEIPVRSEFHPISAISGSKNAPDCPWSLHRQYLSMAFKKRPKSLRIG
jgi:hypothetical protein